MMKKKFGRLRKLGRSIDDLNARASRIKALKNEENLINDGEMVQTLETGAAYSLVPNILPLDSLIFSAPSSVRKVQQRAIGRRFSFNFPRASGFTSAQLLGEVTDVAAAAAYGLFSLLGRN